MLANDSQTFMTFFCESRKSKEQLIPLTLIVWIKKQTFFKISGFVLLRRNDMRLNKWWQSFHFLVKYPFKIISLDA